MKASASAIVLLSFQFPAMYGVRAGFTTGPPRRQRPAFDELQRCAAARGEMSTCVEAELRERGGRVTAADDRHCRRGSHRLGHLAGPAGERLELEGAHGTVPEDRPASEIAAA
jgi:hypothetical protein